MIPRLAYEEYTRPKLVDKTDFTKPYNTGLLVNPSPSTYLYIDAARERFGYADDYVLPSCFYYGVCSPESCLLDCTLPKDVKESLTAGMALVYYCRNQKDDV